jgi:hypothetical protein
VKHSVSHVAAAVAEPDDLRACSHIRGTRFAATFQDNGDATIRRPIVMNSQSADPVVPGGTVIDIMLGTVFLFVGMAACCVAALRRRGASLPLVWFGLFIGMYGLRMPAVAESVSWPAVASVGLRADNAR